MTQPDVEPPLTVAQRAIALLQSDQLTEDDLREARRLLARASELVPYLGEAPHCWKFRKNVRSTTCSDLMCGRCRALTTKTIEES